MSSAVAPPSVLGRYELGVPLGGGPTGEVYRARLAGVAGFAKEYALKVFHPTLVRDDAPRERLLLGLKAAQGLLHPRIVRLHEHLTADAWVFAVSDLVPGVDLSRFLSLTYGVGHELMPGAMLFVITQIARTLGYAHGRGVVHAGICPTNVLVLGDGDVKVTDFALMGARLGDSPADDKTLAARLPYLSPEQLVGAKVTAASDVFQLGVLAHELFTGERAFGGGSGVEIAARIMAGSARDAPIPVAVRDVLRKALAPRAEDRFPDGAAMAGALDAVGLRAALPGGRLDVAAAAKKMLEQAASEAAATIGSGAVTMPLPAPPLPAPPSGAPFTRTLRIQTDLTRRDATPPRGSGPPAVPPPAAILPSTTNTKLRAVSAPPPIPVEPGMSVSADVLRQDTLRGVGSPAEVAATRTEPTAAVEPSFEDGLSAEDLETYRGELLEVAKTPPPEASSGRTDHRSTNGSRPLSFDEIPDLRNGRKTELVDALDDQVADAPKKAGGGRALALVGAFAVAAGGVVGVYFVRPDLLPLELVGLDAKTQPTRASSAPDPIPPTPPVAAVVPPVAVDAAKVAALATAPDAAPAATSAPDATPAVAIAGPPDAAPRVAVLPPDAAPKKVVASPPDAAPKKVAVAPTPVPTPTPTPQTPAVVTPSAGALTISSVPTGAKVYIDGALKGNTPVELGASADRHKLAVIKEGFAPYKADVDGSGEVAVTLAPAAKLKGPAGIKVKCKTRGRLYVMMDGQPTGRLCPTEDRMNVGLGTHTVELYDPVTDETTTHTVDVKDTHFSVKLKVDN